MKCMGELTYRWSHFAQWEQNANVFGSSCHFHMGYPDYPTSALRSGQTCSYMTEVCVENLKLGRVI
ncbi:hypothetical protein KFK09_022892 [Dendrobium nobile]|uniref:Uncharacterized protein n=1 Tax=Dendrobium nobile TaxID=94219 RepID=A0A8T3AL72_DENNO|nr:hypothetical protein KFK09_022892 [Dendrobium nobile]